MKEMFGIDTDSRPIITCPGCGHKNRLSELIWNKGIARCTGKTCDWKFRIIFEGRKKEINYEKAWRKLKKEVYIEDGTDTKGQMSRIELECAE